MRCACICNNAPKSSLQMSAERVIHDFSSKFGGDEHYVSAFLNILSAILTRASAVADGNVLQVTMRVMTLVVIVCVVGYIAWKLFILIATPVIFALKSLVYLVAVVAIFVTFYSCVREIEKRTGAPMDFGSMRSLPALIARAFFNNTE